MPCSVSLSLSEIDLFFPRYSAADRYCTSVALSGPVTISYATAEAEATYENANLS